MTEFLSLLVTGVVTGSIYAVRASGLVVTYNATGIFNFAHGAVGMFLAYLYWQLWQGWGWNPVLSLVIVLLVVAPAVRPGRGTGRSCDRSTVSSLNTMIVVTLGLFLILYGLTGTIWNQTVVRNLPSWFASDQVDVLNVNLTYEQLITVGCAVAVAVGLWVLFRRTRTRGLHAGGGRRPGSGLDDRGPVQPHLRVRLDDRLHVRRPGRDPVGPGHRHEHPDPLRAGDLRLRRGHRRSPAQPAADLPRGP